MAQKIQTVKLPTWKGRLGNDCSVYGRFLELVEFIMSLCKESRKDPDAHTKWSLLLPFVKGKTEKKESYKRIYCPWRRKTAMGHMIKFIFAVKLSWSQKWGVWESLSSSAVIQELLPSQDLCARIPCKGQTVNQNCHADSAQQRLY